MTSSTSVKVEEDGVAISFVVHEPAVRSTFQFEGRECVSIDSMLGGTAETDEICGRDAAIVTDIRVNGLPVTLIDSHLMGHPETRGSDASGTVGWHDTASIRGEMWKDWRSEETSGCSGARNCFTLERILCLGRLEAG